MSAEHTLAPACRPTDLPEGRWHMCVTPPFRRRRMSVEHISARARRPVGLPGGKRHMAAEHTPAPTCRPAGREVAHVS